MAKINQKSLDAKAYINGKVSDMREKFTKAPNDGTKKQLVETFRETTSSDEYQENLAIVQKDTEAVRNYAKRQKWWDITSKEFKDARTEFYGKDMDLNLWEDFEKLSRDEQYKYIIDKFWYTQYSFDCFMRYKLVGIISDKDRSNFSNLNNSSAQYVLNNADCWGEMVFFKHIWSFWDFNEVTLNLLIKWIPYCIGYMNGYFSEKDTKYILNHIDMHGYKQLKYISLFINYKKFKFWKWKDSLESMINYLYTNQDIRSKWAFLDAIDEFKKRKNKESFEKYKILPKNVKIIKVIKACDPGTNFECDKILSLDVVWKNKEVLEWYMQNYNRYAVCNRKGRREEENKDMWISEDMLLKAKKQLQSMIDKKK